MMLQKCARCSGYKLHPIIRWDPKRKELLCERHFTEVLEEEAKLKK